jgi:transcriptional regulator with XRE-family HTH domain
MSTICKPRLDEFSAHRLGQEIRRRRAALGMTQSDVAEPFSKAFVCAVESGRCVPSLSALLLLADRLNTTGAELLQAVNPRLSALYTAADAIGPHQHSARREDGANAQGG